MKSMSVWTWAIFLSVWAAPTASAVTEAELLAAADSGRSCAASMTGMGDGSDVSRTKEAFLDCLGRYVRLATVNPPGHEELAVSYLEAVAQGVGLPSLRLSARGRHNLVVTLTPSGAARGPKELEPFRWDDEASARPSILLLNHMDVVDVFSEQWVRADLAFSGTIAPFPGHDDGRQYLWGRGALDMKGIGMLQLFSMALLKQSRAPMTKTIHFLAVADEEQSAIGASTIIREIRRGGKLAALLGAQLLFGEGGFGVTDVLGKGTVLQAIGAEEKGGSWMRFEHADPKSLLADLAWLHLVPVHSRDRDAAGWGCRLESSHTPKAKVNVVPSTVTLGLACHRVPPAERLAGLFTAGVQGLQAKVDTAGNRLTVTLVTPSSSHGSVGLSASALEMAAAGLQRLGAVKVKQGRKPSFFQYYQTEATRELIRNIGKSHGFSGVPHIPKLDWWIRNLPFVEQRALGYLGGKLASERLFRTSCTWTSFDWRSGQAASAMLDCRLMHPAAMGLKAGRKEGSQFAALVKSYLRDAGLSVSVIEEWNFTGSGVGHPALGVLREEVQRENPRAIVSPFLFPGGTDNHYFRDPATHGSELASVPSFGFFPVELTLELAGTQHGSNERYPVDQVIPSARIYSRVLGRLAK